MKIADLPYLVSYTLLNETFPENNKYYETLFSFRSMKIIIHDYKNNNNLLQMIQLKNYITTILLKIITDIILINV